ncbi:MAG: Crp/Fnr family transcriptional regulator, partial [Alcaligenaceae bacterium]
MSSPSLELSAAWMPLLTAEQRARVEHDTSLQQVSAGAMIERRGEPSLAWIGVISGLIKISVGNADGKLASLTGVPAGG